MIWWLTGWLIWHRKSSSSNAYIHHSLSLSFVHSHKPRCATLFLLTIAKQAIRKVLQFEIAAELSLLSVFGKNQFCPQPKLPFLSQTWWKTLAIFSQPNSQVDCFGGNLWLVREKKTLTLVLFSLLIAILLSFYQLHNHFRQRTHKVSSSCILTRKRHVWFLKWPPFSLSNKKHSIFYFIFHQKLPFIIFLGGVCTECTAVVATPLVWVILIFPNKWHSSCFNPSAYIIKPFGNNHRWAHFIFPDKGRAEWLIRWKSHISLCPVFFSCLLFTPPGELFLRLENRLQCEEKVIACGR